MPTQAADLVSVGSVDATSANLWPLHIAQKNGYFDAANLKIDLVFAQSNASVIQQLAAGSYAVAPSAGMVDPIRAIDKGAPVALVRIVIQAPPYALLARPEIKKIEDLKGKTIIIGGAKDITRIFTERMLEPHGLKSGDYDHVFAGATSARFAALKSGAVDAALLTVPFNFYAEFCGLHQSRLHLRLSARHAVRRHGGEPRLGGGEWRRAETLSRLLQQGRRLVRRSGQPRRRGQAADGGEQDRPGRRGKGVRLSPRQEFCSSRLAKSPSAKSAT